MKIITQRDLIRGVAHEWSLTEFWTKESRAIHKQLRKLNLETCSAEDVERIIGNNTWTRLWCDECGREFERLVELGPSADSLTSITSKICRECAEKASKL